MVQGDEEIAARDPRRIPQVAQEAVSSPGGLRGQQHGDTVAAVAARAPLPVGTEGKRDFIFSG